MKLNVKLLRETLQTIKENPEHWDQLIWHCGSSHCFAGFVDCKVRGLDYWEKITDDKADEMNRQECDELISLLHLDKDTSTEFQNAYKYHTNTLLIARFALGLQEDEANQLFYGDNTLKDLERIVEDFTQDQESSD